MAIRVMVERIQWYDCSTRRRSTSDWGDIYKIIGFRVCDVSIIIRELPG